MFLRKFCFIPTLLFVLCGLVLSTPNVEAQTVHALVVVMNADESIGKGMEKNLEKINTFLDDVRSQYSVKQETFRSTDDEKLPTPDAVLQWIRNLRPAADDVVFFYYGGHGGMVSETNQRTFLFLTDGKLYRDKIEEVMRSVSCRLKLIITDCCSSYPDYSDVAEATRLTSYGTVVGRNHITDLFGKHEGLLHVNGTTEGSYGWVNLNRGGFFTTSLMESIHPGSDKNRDGFLEWHEVLRVASTTTQETFKSNYFSFANEYKNDPQTKLQTPKVYSTPISVHWDPRDRPDDRDGASGLWELENRRSDIRLSLSTGKRGYQLRDYLKIRLEADRDCYITLFNWEADGTFKQLFPNEYDSDNFIRAGSSIDFPTRRSNFDIRLNGPEGIERFKLVAVRSKAVSDRINNVLPRSGVFGKASIGDGEVKKMADIEGRVGIEDEIADILRDIDDRDWATDNATINLRR